MGKSIVIPLRNAMELRHIRYFLAVAEERNFTRAAEKVGIGQPPFSRQIKDLETEVGARLFHRVPHGAELTEAGSAFLEAVKGFPEQTSRAVRLAQRAARGETGSLRLGYTGAAAYNRAIPLAIRRFRRAYPDVDLSLREANTTLLVEAVESGELDVAFLRTWTDLTGHLRLRRVAEEPMLAVVPTGHRVSRQKTVNLRDLRSERFVLIPRSVGPDFFDAIVSACRESGFEPDVDQSAAPQINSVVSLVSAELGVSLVPPSTQQLRMAGVAYVPIKGRAPTARLSLAHRRGDTSTIVRNFIDCALG
jgi:DNA-binding transcriptional LysR family regulator